jgi:hypothetical protein
VFLLSFTIEILAVGNKDKPTKSYVLKNVLPKEYRMTNIISWEKNNEEDIMGLLTVILSLIHVNGRVLSDGE